MKSRLIGDQPALFSALEARVFSIMNVYGSIHCQTVAWR